MYESYINKIEDVGKLRNLKPGTIANSGSSDHAFR